MKVDNVTTLTALYSGGPGKVGISVKRYNDQPEAVLDMSSVSCYFGPVKVGRKDLLAVWTLLGRVLTDWEE